MRSIASLVLLLASCTACGAAVGEQVPFSTLGKGTNSGVREQAQVVVRTQSEWVSLWGRHMRTRTAPPPPPAVDFSTEMVVALFLGERPTGGYAIEVTRVERTDTGLSVRFRVTKPAPGTMQTQMLTQPFDLIKLPRVDESLTFIAESPSG
jgi:hypothetical protein